MAQYPPHTWANGDTISATRLNALEQGAAASMSAVAVQAVASAAGALAANGHTPVDASGGALSMSLPASPTAGDLVSVEKVDASVNVVTVTGSLRGVGAQSITLTTFHETKIFIADSIGSWWPISDHRTKTALDTAYGDPGVAAIVGNTASATTTALRAAYAASALPSAAVAGGAVTQRWNAQTSTYGVRPAKLARFRAKRAQALAGAGLCRIVCLGDSTTAGQPTAGVARATTSFPAYLRAQMAAAGVPVTGTGMVPASQSSTTNPDARWTFSGTWADGALFRQSGAISSTATFTSDVAGTVVEIEMFKGSNGNWTYSIDGAAAVTITNQTGSGLYKTTVTGLANTTHTVVITQTTSTALQLVAAQVRGTTGITVTNVGVGGTTTGTWIASSYAGNTVALAEPPDLVLINLGINDYFTSTAVATFQANLTTIAGFYTPTCDVVLAVGNPVSSSTSPVRSAYTAATYAVGEALGLPVLDLIDRWVDYPTASAGSLIYSDGTHPVPAGNADIARAWIEGLGLA